MAVHVLGQQCRGYWIKIAGTYLPGAGVSHEWLVRVARWMPNVKWSFFSCLSRKDVSSFFQSYQLRKLLMNCCLTGYIAVTKTHDPKQLRGRESLSGLHFLITDHCWTKSEQEVKQGCSIWCSHRCQKCVSYWTPDPIQLTSKLGLTDPMPS